MGCTDDPADSQALYWMARGVDPATGLFTCCGADAERSNGASPGKHKPDCRMTASLRAEKVETILAHDWGNDLVATETTVDDEVTAMAGIVAALGPLDDAARQRVLDWANDRFY